MGTTFLWFLAKFRNTGHSGGGGGGGGDLDSSHPFMALRWWVFSTYRNRKFKSSSLINAEVVHAYNYN